MGRRVFVLGLDGVPPSLLFDDLRGEMQNTNRFLQTAHYGSLRSTDPPITCPAWMTMMTGKDPGQLAIYGFRNRSGYGYEQLRMVSSRDVKHQTVWDNLSSRGKKVIVVGVPPSYPPKPVNGFMVSCFLTPGINNVCTYPNSFKEELLKVAPRYRFDLKDFRTPEKKRVMEDLYEITRMHFRLVRHMLETKPWDFFMFSEIATDRVHHGFWKFFDPNHPRHDPASPYRNAIRDYYRMLDEEIGTVLGMLDDRTDVFMVSDHGAKAIRGGIAVNQYLIEEGFLILKEKKDGIFSPDPALIDWSKTKVWAEGGYYARVFINVNGREPEGVVPQSEYESFRARLKEKFESIRDENGNRLETRVLYPGSLYRETKGIPPDLMVYFDNLNWRSIGTVGYPSIYAAENDTGPDDANHSEQGVFVFRGGDTHGKQIEELHISQVGGKVLEIFG